MQFFPHDVHIMCESEIAMSLWDVSPDADAALGSSELAAKHKRLTTTSRNLNGTSRGRVLRGRTLTKDDFKVNDQ
jgi:hypothetical protein